MKRAWNRFGLGWASLAAMIFASSSAAPPTSSASHTTIDAGVFRIDDDAASVSAAAADRAEELSAIFRAVARDMERSVCRIVSFQPTRMGLARATGSGFVVRSNGYLLTNYHVVKGAIRVGAELPDGRTVPAEIVGTDALTDLAVLRIQTTDLPAVRFADAPPTVGDWVVAFGCPLGLAQTMTAGIVSATNRRLNILGNEFGKGYEDYIQTDAAINRGNSGGPLVNLQGEVVGVNSVIVTQTGGSDGLGFAVPSSLARYVADQIIEHGRVRRGYLGVGIQDLDPALSESYGLPATQKGALVNEVSANLPAARAGLVAEDVIVSINGETVNDAADLRTRIAMIGPDHRADLEVLRAGGRMQFEITLAEMESDAGNAPRPVVFSEAEFGRLGMKFADLRNGDSVLVEAVVPLGPAALAGIEAGDVVVAVNGQSATSFVENIDGRRIGSPARGIAAMIERAPAGSFLRLSLRRPSSPASLLKPIVAVKLP